MCQVRQYRTMASDRLEVRSYISQNKQAVEWVRIKDALVASLLEAPRSSMARAPKMVPRESCGRQRALWPPRGIRKSRVVRHSSARVRLRGG
ncbi:hypothetical protein SCLCIDRAFT_1207131 [Scleroderma citrinum Foug A]|uniref:Uncharacterized protein n=1 Tax=Scleroderma citrinum Foug A TaxID=1036808 RepID=A0A0C3ES30_9AGAM|nr:hypothetical protein SCLCIDRAFT_1207131 [Scleroderma citrinum Foug A]